MLITLIVFLFILSLLVLIHEAGHFFVAKFFGIKVEEFGYGLPPRAWGKKIGETLYSINWLPFGGFVKLYGEDEAGSGSVAVPKSELPTKDLDRAFFTRSVSQRAAVVVAGVVMNALLAVLIYYVFLGLSGFKTELPYFGSFRFLLADQQRMVKSILIRGVTPDSPASKAGLKPCSRSSCMTITALNGEKITSGKAFIDTINKFQGKPITLTFSDEISHTSVTKTLTPRVNPPKNQGRLGIMFDINEVIAVSYVTPVQRMLSGIMYPIDLLRYQFHILSTIIGFSIKEKTAAPLGDAVSGPVGIYNVVGSFIQIPDAKERFLQLLNLTGLLSLSLAFFNVLPIPALDGGRLFFIVIEGITRRKVSPKFEAMAHTVGMAVLLTLILLVTFKDIFQLFR